MSYVVMSAELNTALCDCVFDSLCDLNVKEDWVTGHFDELLADGPISPFFTQVVAWLATEIADFTGLDDRVNVTVSQDEAFTFLIELAGFLRALQCPLPNLMKEDVNERLKSKQDRLDLLSYLTSEAQACRLIAKNNPEIFEFEALEKTEQKPQADTVCPEGVLLQKAFAALSFGCKEAPSEADAASRIVSLSQSLVKKVKPQVLGNPVLTVRSVLSANQWRLLENVNKALVDEFTLRRQMLITRVDVTVKSFLWSPTGKKREKELVETYNKIRTLMYLQPQTSLAHILASRDDILFIERIDSPALLQLTKNVVKRTTMGAVPDRGGRVDEMKRPPPEMPSFMPRHVGGGGGHRGGGHDGGGHRGGGGGGRGRGDHQGGDRPQTSGGGGGFGGGGRVQGGWGGRPQSAGGRGGGRGRGRGGYT